MISHLLTNILSEVDFIHTVLAKGLWATWKQATDLLVVGQERGEHKKGWKLLRPTKLSKTLKLTTSDDVESYLSKEWIDEILDFAGLTINLFHFQR